MRQHGLRVCVRVCARMCTVSWKVQMFVWVEVEGFTLSLLSPLQEAYSVARQFNLIPPVCEQAEYHLFQREKVEVQLPELYHKIGMAGVLWFFGCFFGSWCMKQAKFRYVKVANYKEAILISLATPIAISRNCRLVFWTLFSRDQTSVACVTSVSWFTCFVSRGCEWDGEQDCCVSAAYPLWWNNHCWVMKVCARA